MALCNCLYLIFQPSRAPEFKGSMKDVLWISDSPVTLSNLISPPNPTFKKLFTFYWGEGHTVIGQFCEVWFFFSHLYMGFRDQTQALTRAEQVSKMFKNLTKTITASPSTSQAVSPFPLLLEMACCLLIVFIIPFLFLNPICDVMC